jgi:hypothetical protein
MFIAQRPGNELVTQEPEKPGTIFPNPSSSEVVIRVAAAERIRSVQVVDFTGRRFSVNYKTISSNEIKADISSLANGTYSAIVLTENLVTMKKYLILLLLPFFITCKKEGLSGNTGNLEIHFNSVSVIDGYDLYTEEQYSRFINYEWPFTPYRSSLYTEKKIEERGLPEGSYGIYMWVDGRHYQQLFYISDNKVNRLSMF